MKITRDKALAMTAYCRRHNIKYVGEGSYPNTVKSAMRLGTKAPNGVAIHFPRDWVDERQQALVENSRAYVLWQGEDIPAIEEACAYILMISRDKTIYIVRCKHASQAAKEIEQCESQSE